METGLILDLGEEVATGKFPGKKFCKALERGMFKSQLHRPIRKGLLLIVSPIPNSFNYYLIPFCISLTLLFTTLQFYPHSPISGIVAARVPN